MGIILVGTRRRVKCRRRALEGQRWNLLQVFSTLETDESEDLLQLILSRPVLAFVYIDLADVHSTQYYQRDKKKWKRSKQ